MRKSTAAQIAASGRYGARSRAPFTRQTRAKSALTSSTVLLNEIPNRFKGPCPQSSLEFCATALNEAAGFQAWRRLPHRRNHDFQNILIRQPLPKLKLNCTFNRFRTREALRPEQLTNEAPNGKIEPEN